MESKKNKMGDLPTFEGGTTGLHKIGTEEKRKRREFY
jgi:hypothetical protein